MEGGDFHTYSDIHLNTSISIRKASSEGPGAFGDKTHLKQCFNRYLSILSLNLLGIINSEFD